MYSIIFLSALIIILLIILFKQLKITRNAVITTLLSLIILYFIVTPQSCMKYAMEGAKLFISAIFPTIFPFMVLCNILIAYDGIEIYSKILGPVLCRPLGISKNSTFAIVASVFCGYPIGAKYSSELYEKGYIEKDEFQRLINIASNSGPIFTIGALGATMLGNKYLGMIIMFSCYVSAFIIGVLTRKDVVNKSNDANITDIHYKTFGNILKDAVTDGINGILLIGGYVIIFSIIMSIIKNNALTSVILSNLSVHFKNTENVYGTILGMLDLTNGCNIISASTLSTAVKICILSFLCAFGSLSVVAQVNAFLYKYNIDLKKYITLKLLQGVLAAIISLALFLILPIKAATFGSSSYIITYISMETIAFILIAALVIIYNLFHVS